MKLRLDLPFVLKSKLLRATKVADLLRHCPCLGIGFAATARPTPPRSKTRNPQFSSSF